MHRPQQPTPTAVSGSGGRVLPPPPCHTTVRTGPYTAVREVTPLLVDQRRKTERFEIGIGKPDREGFGLCEIPGAESAAGGVTFQPGKHPQLNQFLPATAGGFFPPPPL